MTELPKFSHLEGNRVEEHDGDVRFQTGSGLKEIEVEEHDGDVRF